MSTHARTTAAVLGAAALLGTVLAALPAGAVTPPAAASVIPPQAASLGLTACDVYGGQTICSGSVPSFDGSPMDLDLTMPTQDTGARHPLMVMLHGFGNDKHEWESTTDGGDGADKYHWNSHWFAEHGYYVLTYTARGFRDEGAKSDYEPTTPGASCGSACDTKSTIRVKNKNVEIRDTQWLAAQTAAAFAGSIDPKQVAVSGGSYGGGESWLQAAEPTWTFPHDYAQQQGQPPLPVLNLQVAVPKYPWTDLAYSLAPNGHGGGPKLDDIYASSTGRQNDPDGNGNPFGVGKLSYTTGLYALGTATGVFENGQNLSSPQDIPPDPELEPPAETYTAWLARIGAGEPYSVGPGTDDPEVGQIRRAFSHWHSAYYQPGWVAQKAAGHETAVFSISGWTDDLFPPVESFRMFKYLKSLDPMWPVAVAVGDVGHSRAQNKPATWHRINDQAWQFLQSQISGAHQQQTTVYSEPTTCTATDTPPAEQLTAQTPESLASGTLTVDASAKPATLDPTSGVADPNNQTTDATLGSNIPSASGSGGCRVAQDPGNDGVGGPTGYRAYSAPLAQRETTVGIQYVTADYTSAVPGDAAVVAARVWDVAPDGSALLLTRGVYRFDFLYGDPAAGTVRVPFYGNHWNLQPGHRVRLDLQQVDEPTYKQPTGAIATLGLSNIKLVLPTRQASTVVSPAS